MFIAGEGDIVDRRYRILHITPVSVEVEDVLNNNKQTYSVDAGVVRLGRWSSVWSLAFGGWFGTDSNVQRRVPAISRPSVVKMQLMARPTTDDQRARANDDHRRRDHSRRSERGYILLMLMLFVALLAIAAGAVAPTIAFRVKRDREEEMIHRGVQYSRALRRFVKKDGTLPESNRRAGKYQQHPLPA